jgi:hypothetical protein
MTGQKRERRQRPRKAAPPPSFFERYRVAIIAIAVVAGVLIVGLVFFQSATAKPYTCDTLLTPPPNQAADPSQPGFVTPQQGRTHVPVGTTINYGFCPPTSGNHYFSPPRGPIPPAVYGPSTEQPPGGWVHNLEHGYVVLAYRCPSGVLGQGDCATQDEMSSMQQWFNAAPIDPTCGTRKVLVARFDSMKTRFGVLAWNRAFLVDDLGSANFTLATNFRDAFTSTTAPEPNNC